MSPVAIAILTILATIATYYAANPKHDRRRAYRLALIPTALGLTLGIGQCKAAQDRAHLDATSGVLLPEHREAAREPITVLMGTEVYNFVGTGFTSEEGFVLDDFMMWGRLLTPLRIRLTDSGIKLSGQIYSLDGAIVAELVDNEWRSNPGAYFRRRYDRSRIEIVDNQGFICFQLRFLTPTKIRIGGFMPVHGGMMAVTDSFVETRDTLDIAFARRKISSGEWILTSLFK